MKLPSRITNTCLATLLQGAGFASMEQFATAVNARAWHMHGVKLIYDHISVRRWLASRACSCQPSIRCCATFISWLRRLAEAE